MRHYRPHEVTPQERRVFVLRGDKKTRAVAITRRRKSSKTKYQPLIVWVRDKKPIKSEVRTATQYINDVRTFVQSEE